MWMLALNFLKSRVGLAAAALAIGLMIAGTQTWRLHSTQVTVAQQQTVIVQLNANVQTLKANQAELRGAINDANGKLDAMAKRVDAFNQAATAAAAKLLSDDARRKRDAKIKGAGPDVMNQWTQETFGHGR